MEEREVGVALMSQARHRMAEGELTVAGKLADRARDLFVEAEDLHAACAAAAVAGHARMRGGDMAGAREAFEWVQAEATTHGLVTQELAARTDLGALMELGGDLDGALAMHEAILSRCLEQADPMAAANAAGNVGRLLTRLMRYDEAAKLLQESLEGFVALGHGPGQANAHICLGDLCRARGEGTAAEAHFDAACALTSADEAAPLRLVALLNVGHLRRDRGDLAGALDAFAGSAELAEAHGDAQGVARARLAEGMALADLAHPRDALSCFEQAERSFVEIGQPGGALAAAVNKAAVQCRLGMLREGSEVLDNARSVLAEVGDTRAVQEVTFALCEVALGLGDAGRAEALLAEVPTDELGPRLLLRHQLVEARLQLRGLLLERAAASAVLPEGLDPTPGERFAVALVQAEGAVLSGAPDAAERIAGMDALTETMESPREVGALGVLRGQRALWVGDLDGARSSYLRARGFWRQMEEPVPEMQAQSALWWIDVLRGEGPLEAEVRLAEQEARDLGLVDQADALACLATTVRVLAGRRSDRHPDEQPSTDAIIAAAAPLVFRGNRLSAAVVLALSAGATGDEALREEAAGLASGTRLTPPMVGAWRRPVATTGLS